MARDNCMTLNSLDMQCFHLEIWYNEVWWEGDYITLFSPSSHSHVFPLTSLRFTDAPWRDCPASRPKHLVDTLTLVCCIPLSCSPLGSSSSWNGPWILSLFFVPANLVMTHLSYTCMIRWIYGGLTLTALKYVCFNHGDQMLRPRRRPGCYKFIAIEFVS